MKVIKLILSYYLINCVIAQSIIQQGNLNNTNGVVDLPKGKLDFYILGASVCNEAPCLMVYAW